MDSPVGSNTVAGVGDPGLSADLLSKRWLLWGLISAGVALLILTNLPWHLDDYDQAKQAYTSYEMVKQGHWFYQHTPRGRIATKPPLIGWISAATYAVTRSWTVAWRLPSIAAALGIAWLLVLAGKRAAGRSGAVIAASAFLFNLLTPRLGSLVRTDMPLALVIFAAGWLIWNHIRADESWSVGDRAILLLLLVAGTFIKGPIIYAFLLPGLVIYGIWRRKNGAATGWPGWWPWIVSLVPLALWTGIAIRSVPGFYEQVFLREFLGRFSENVHTPQPFYFYLPHLLQKLAPWSLLLLILLWLRWRERPNKHDRTQDAATMWLVCWIAGGLLVMSAIPSKRVDRIFPLVPPICLLLAVLPASLFDAKKRTIAWRATVVSVLAGVVLTVIYSSAKTAVTHRDNAGALVEFGKEVRQWAAQADWRYAAVYGGDEGMILYLDRTSFVEQGSAISEWNAGNLDVLVVPARDVQIYTRALQPAPVTFLRSRSRGDDKPDYVLLEHRE